MSNWIDKTPAPVRQKEKHEIRTEWARAVVEEETCASGWKFNVWTHSADYSDEYGKHRVTGSTRDRYDAFMLAEACIRAMSGGAK